MQTIFSLWLFVALAPLMRSKSPNGIYSLNLLVSCSSTVKAYSCRNYTQRQLENKICNKWICVSILLYVFAAMACCSFPSLPFRETSSSTSCMKLAISGGIRWISLSLRPSFLSFTSWKNCWKVKRNVYLLKSFEVAVVNQSDGLNFYKCYYTILYYTTTILNRMWFYV